MEFFREGTSNQGQCCLQPTSTSSVSLVGITYFERPELGATVPCSRCNLFSLSSSILRLVIAMFRFLYSSRFVSETSKEGVSVQSGSSLVFCRDNDDEPHAATHTQGRRIIGVGTPLCVCIDWLDCNYNYQKKAVRHSSTISSPHVKSGKHELNQDIQS